MLKAVFYILVAAFAGILFLIAANFYGDSRAGKVYANASRGQMEASILQALGSPDEELPCGQYLWWDGDTANPEPNHGVCVKWVRYNYLLSGWAFGYSSDGTLVSRYHYVSE
jgi:hypothetical protein